MAKTINVIKRDGSQEPYQIEKIQKQIEYACSGFDNVSQSMIEIGMNIEVFDGIKTETIDQLAINAAANLINPDNEGGNVNYQYVAGRLQNSVLRKQVYGQFEPWHLRDIIKRGVEVGLYTDELLEYTDEEIDILDASIDHTKDEFLSYAAIKQFIDKYLVRNRVTGQIIDTPQARYMISAMIVFLGETNGRIKKIIDYYKQVSNGDFTLPTPMLAGLGTPTKQFSSCVLLRSDDTVDSIFATGEMVAKYSAKRAGIGLEVGRLRPLGAPIRKGEITHTGMTPFLKKWFGDLRCTSQGGIRNSSCTVNYPWWHAEFENLIVLKNNRGTEETRVRHMDYAVAINRMLLRRYKSQETVTLFDPNQVPELYEAFYRDSEEFKHLYNAAEKNPNLTKQQVSAVDLLNKICDERSGTGRIYLFFVDNVSEHSVFDTKVDPVYQTNLCAEILEPTQPFQRLEDAGHTTIEWVNSAGETLTKTFNNASDFWEDQDRNQRNFRTLMCGDYVSMIHAGGESYGVFNKVKLIEQTRPSIALCTLGSINWGKFKRPEQLRNACRTILRGLDNVLDYQDYLSIQSELSTKEFRHLGVGVTNLAYWHAKRGLKYGSPEALAEVARWMEHQAYYLIEASIDLAKERGACDRFRFTRWAKGEFPHERSPATLDEIREWSPTLDWEALRDKLLTYGIRNAVTSAIAPVESSSCVIDSTNGIELPKALVSSKDSRGSILTQVVPDYNRYKDNYETMWGGFDCEEYLKTAATIAQFVDQSISTNTFYDPGKFEGGRIPRTRYVQHLFNAQRWGLRTLYYQITNKSGFKAMGDLVESEPEAAQEVEFEDEVCEGCTL